MDSLLEHADVRPTRHKLSAGQYLAMAEAGILDEDGRIELIEGEIVEIAPIGREHGGAVAGLTRALVLACDGRAVVFVQSSLKIDHWNVPEPDFAVLQFRKDDYVTGAPPSPADALLVVEVAQSSLGYDRNVKLPLYARAGIPEYWIVNLEARMVDRYRRPEGEAYTEETQSKAGETVALFADPEIRVTFGIVFA